MKHSLVTALLSIVSIVSFAQAPDPCATQRNTQEIDACGVKTLKEKDKELNTAYQKLIKSLAPSDKFDDTDYTSVKAQLTKAQRAWIVYRDNDCKAQYTQSASGTIRGAVYNGCMAERTEQRTKELLKWGALE